MCWVSLHLCVRRGRNHGRGYVALLRTFEGLRNRSLRVSLQILLASVALQMSDAESKSESNVVFYPQHYSSHSGDRHRYTTGFSQVIFQEL